MLSARLAFVLPMALILLAATSFLSPVLGQTSSEPSLKLDKMATKDKTVILDWNSVPDATGYRISRNSSSSSSIILKESIIATEYVDTDSKLQEGVPYYYAVSALDQNGDIIITESVSVIPVSEINHLELFFAIFGSAASVYVIYYFANRFEKKNTVHKRGEHKWSDLIRDHDCFPSLARLQFLLWSFFAIFLYFLIVLIRVFHGIGAPDISDNTLFAVLLGLSGATVVAGNGISKSRYKKKVPQGDKPVKLRSIFEEGNRFELTRFQMFVWTLITILIVVITTIIQIGNNWNAVDKLTVPSIDETLVILMGLSQAAYIGGKYAQAEKDDDKEKEIKDEKTKNTVSDTSEN